MGGLLQARTKLGLNSSLALPWLFPPLCVGREAPPGNLCVSRFVPRGWIRLSSLGLIGLTTLIPPDPGFLGIPPFTLEGPISCISPDPSVVAMPECMAEYSGTPRATAKQDRGLRAVDLRFKIHLARGVSGLPPVMPGARDFAELAISIAPSDPGMERAISSVSRPSWLGGARDYEGGSRVLGSL